MTTHPRIPVFVLSALLLALGCEAFADGPAPPVPADAECLETADGLRVFGRLDNDAQRGFRFVASDGRAATPLSAGCMVRFPGRGPSTATGLPPFRLDLGMGQRISGRLLGLDGKAVRLTDAAVDATVNVERLGVISLMQRPGETLVFQDGFEVLDSTRWTILGEPELVEEPKVAGAHALRMMSGGVSLTHRLAEPFGSGRLEVAFHDTGAIASGTQWFVELTFRGANGPERVRVVLGWSEDSLAVESPSGPALSVQRLSRKPGWHRLNVRFGQEECEIGVDGNELAHGKGVGGPLTEIRLAGVGQAKATPGGAAVGGLDDLRLVKYAETVGELETDVTQDEVRLTSGDQIFGEARGADPERVRLTVDGKDVALSWGEVAGLYFRRDADPGAVIEGLLVRVEWRAAQSHDPRDLNVMDGALAAISAERLTLATPHAGVLAIPRARLTSVVVSGRGRRYLLDSKPHHLGDQQSITPPLLDPPQPEGGVFERTLDLPNLPAGAATLVLDVVQVAGEAPDLEFAALVKKGECRTNLKINGEPFDYLNRFIVTRNETPERVRVPIPRGLLRTGRNVVRLEQTGTADNPNFLDDLGLLGLALEFAPEARQSLKPVATRIHAARKPFVKSLTRSLVRHAHAIAREAGARVILLYADVIEDDTDLNDLIQDVDFRVILVSRRQSFRAPEGWGDLCAIVRVPDIMMTRAGQIKVATLVAAAESLIQMGDRVLCLTGIDGSGVIDTIIVLDMGSEIEMFADTTADPLPADLTPAVFERLLTLASELGLEGREGRPVGTLFVVGDCERVLDQSHQLVMNPFHGYPETERNVLDPRLEETIKEFSAIDGAFIVRGDGVVLSAGRYLGPRARLDQPLPQGLGTRHEAAACITVSTDAIALCVSQSTGTISIFRHGRLVTDIQKPRGRSCDGL